MEALSWGFCYLLGYLLVKLSAAIEMALTTQECDPLGRPLAYGDSNMGNEFMCLVLPALNLGHFVTDVEDMVFSICSRHGRGSPLSCALHYEKLLNLNDGSWSQEQVMAYTTQLYCWWVFDLKRKGL